MTIHQLETWCVYDRPRDFPNSAVARRFVGESPTPYAIVGPSVEAVRAALAALRPGLVCLARSPGDDPCIVEVWL